MSLSPSTYPVYICLYPSAPCQQRFWKGDNNNSRIMVRWGGLGGEAGVYFLLSAPLTLFIVCLQRTGGQQQQQWGDFEGRREEETEQKCDSPVTISLARREREKIRGRSGWRAQGRKGVVGRGEMWDVKKNWMTTERGEYRTDYRTVSSCLKHERHQNRETGSGMKIK